MSIDIIRDTIRRDKQKTAVFVAAILAAQLAMFLGGVFVLALAARWVLGAL